MLLCAGSALAPAQWLNYKTPGIPRKADGTPNLKAPAPRTTEGKPYFIGMTQIYEPEPLTPPAGAPAGPGAKQPAAQ
jgi:hypothetical protein